MHDIFISYANADKTIADMVCATLEQQGLRCWIAPRDVRPGADWGGSIVEAIRASRIMVLVFSDHANSSRHIPRELERAVDREVPIIPFRIENVLPRGSLEYSLSSLHWLDAISPPIEDHIHQLARTLHAMLGTTLPAQTPPSPVQAATPPRAEVPAPPTVAAAEPDDARGGDPEMTEQRAPERSESHAEAVSPSKPKRPVAIAVALGAVFVLGVVYWWPRPESVVQNEPAPTAPAAAPEVAPPGFDLTRARFKIGLVEMIDQPGVPQYRLIGGETVTQADVSAILLGTDANGQKQLIIQFAQSGAEKMNALTSANIGKTMGFCTEAGEVLLSPRIESAVSDRAAISLGPEEIQTFLSKIQSGR